MTDERFLLKDLIDEPTVTALIRAVASAHPNLDAGAVLAQVFDADWPERALKQRIRHVAVVLRSHLPAAYPQAIAVLSDAARDVDGIGFTAMVFNDFVEEYGVDDPDVSLPALELFTTLTSAEFAIRPFIERYPEAVFDQLLVWAASDDWRVRRLASEGSRPRLPWGMGLRSLKEDPSPILPILEPLRNDDSEDVRRSVANNLNDISKDHPDIVVKVLRAWQDGSPQIDALTKHALRTLLKKGDPGALGLLGFSPDPDVVVRGAKIEPLSAPVGGSVDFHFQVVSSAAKPQSLMIDYVVEYQNVSGTGSRKVFKGRVVALGPGEHVDMRRRIGLDQRTTRKIITGTHAAEVQVNGKMLDRIEFAVTPAPSR